MDFRGKRIFFNFIGSILAILLVAFSFFALVNVVFNVCYIKTDVFDVSMFPTLNASVLNKNEQGDTVYINKFAPPKNGDIVVAKVAWEEKPIIKRLVACPQDTFYIADAGNNFNLFVNEKLFYTMPKQITYPENNKMITSSTSGHYYAFLNLVELYLSTSPERIVQNSAGQNMIKLFENEYLLVGDNWAGSEDVLTVLDSGKSTNFVKRGEIIGKADMYIYKGQNKFSCLFKQMMKLIFSF